MKKNIIGILIIIAITAISTLPFHYVYDSDMGTLIFLKENLSLKNTFTTPQDLKKLQEKIDLLKKSRFALSELTIYLNSFFYDRLDKENYLHIRGRE